jgi:hypothetical protein
MSAAMVSLATITLGSAASSVTFGSIPATYRDLRLVIAVPNSGSVPRMTLTANSDNGTNYSQIRMYGVGSGSGTSNAYAAETTFYTYDASSGAVTNILMDLMDYSATDKHKTALIRMNVADTIVFAQASRWANTAAVTTLTALTILNSYPTGTTLSLYGILA